ncbi:MAG: hypothetical protein K2X35_10110 [Bryobacteraceae bacterium]|nr:hypothetical protein [Bryobacteraceae bacterium]
MQLPDEAIAAAENGDLSRAIRVVQDQTGLRYESAENAVETYLPEKGNPLVELPPDAIQYLLAGRKARAVLLIQWRFGIERDQAERLAANWRAPSGETADDLARQRLQMVTVAFVLVAALFVLISATIGRA